MCVATFNDPSSTMPQLGSTLQQRQKVPVGPAVASWTESAPPSACLSRIYSSHHGWAEPGQGWGNAAMGKRVSHSTGSKGKGKLVIMQHMNNEKSPSGIQKWWQDFVFVETERREERGLEKHNSVLMLPPSFSFLQSFTQMLWITDFCWECRKHSSEIIFHWNRTLKNYFPGFMCGKVKRSGNIHNFSEVAQPVVIFYTFSEGFCFMLRTPNFLLQQHFFFV